uniref:Uncharacterized protein n=1 Tax=Scinaia undulata TaxID=1884664 RepID=A0A1G4NXU3_9FLOR|nr:Hypothetical protein ORF_6 [Scinaia undulata]SCW23488.1 Hypothetical protein ORF_6 [Scinaia undulata]
MTYSFIARNIDLMITSVQSLDPYTLDNLSAQSKILNIKELFLLRMENEIKYESHYKTPTIYNYFIILQELALYVSQIHLQKNIINVLEDFAKNQYNSENYSLKARNYIHRFTINYRKSIQPYLIGHNKYLDDTYIHKIGIVNLFAVSELNTDQGIYFTLLSAINKNE